jgi:hypothetical protein
MQYSIVPEPRKAKKKGRARPDTPFRSAALGFYKD